MKKGTIISLFFTFLLGGAVMFGFNYYYLNYVSKPTSGEYKTVTVTDTGISAGIENIYDAVVVVENYKGTSLSGIGSGFIYDKEGYIMTNQHVIASANEIRIILSDGSTVSGTIVGGDEYADIGIVKINKEYVKMAANIGNSEELKLGDTVFTIGSPMSSNYAGTVTRGILSGKNRMVEVSVNSSSNDWIMNVMQTDAAINPGNSGGPLCNVNGDVIGINSMKIVQDEIEGVGFAIPIEDAIKYANKIVNGEDFNRAYLGITMADISTSKYYLRKYNISIDSSITSGVIVIETETNGPCGEAGVLKGDVITKIGEYNVNNVAELRYYLYKHEPKEKVVLEVIRGIESKSFEVTLGTSE